ncbi:hypothetical protein DNHGIG_00490 [Collibacillus ludicampi]|uniref:WGR domain-containing protein n=1 Tax=Collibacillus ludicampi TaxID=2771369 RepID=A0AAV4L9Q1_9BACL|nr:hypothetical protein [Collibacillus ludicampi]GIM44500.1 hypothetical protein DNHGIG_00490 [Collibacillus ludicampi]
MLIPVEDTFYHVAVVNDTTDGKYTIELRPHSGAGGGGPVVSFDSYKLAIEKAEYFAKTCSLAYRHGFQYNASKGQFIYGKDSNRCIHVAMAIDPEYHSDFLAMLKAKQ